jgi:FtsP/CotA-like multicopper oxidase with cupredoxin domain
MTAMMGMLGDTMLVNGAVLPELAVETRQYRFRLYNGSNARTYDFALSNNAMFNVVGTDGGLLPSPVATDHITLAAGERAEIVVDFGNNLVGDSVSLINRAAANMEIMRFNVATVVNDDVILYTSLPSGAEIYQRLTPADATNQRSFVMSTGGMMGPGGMSFLINGKSFDMNRIDEVVANGATEIWTVSNTSPMAHPFHAHAIQWQVLDRNGVPSFGADLGWKDTVLVRSGETVRIIGRFDPVINRGLYMYHCHILEHEDAGMMGTFQIL